MSLPPQYVRFLHIRKTGGTTLNNVLNGYFPGNPSARTKAIVNAWDSVPELVAVAERFPFLTGHRDMTELCREPCFRFAFFRDPFTRLCSERRQWTQAQPENIAAMDRVTANTTIAFQQQDFVGILDRVFQHPRTIWNFWNHQTLSLGAAPLLAQQRGFPAAAHYLKSQLADNFSDPSQLLKWLFDNADAILSMAVARLRKFDFVGIYENFQDDASVLMHLLGLPAPSVFAHLNARTAYPDEAAAGLFDKAQEFLRLDNQLYAEALALRQARTPLAPFRRRDFTGYKINGNESLQIPADAPPGGYGWHDAAMRGDGGWSRWTSDCSLYAVTLTQRSFEISLRVFGAVSEQALLGARLSLEGNDIATTIRQGDDGVYSIAGHFTAQKACLADIEVRVPSTRDGFGLEIASLGITPL